MRRKIYDKLLEWKKNHKGDTALLIEGARRIGKSYIVEEFARKEYASYILVDFSKVNPQVMEFFNLYLDDLDMLFMNLELYFRRKLTPRQTKDEEARSLVIFDEVQHKVLKIRIYPNTAQTILINKTFGGRKSRYE